MGTHIQCVTTNRTTTDIRFLSHIQRSTTGIPIHYGKVMAEHILRNDYKRPTGRYIYTCRIRHATAYDKITAESGV
jgi:hypothetical protein